METFEKLKKLAKMETLQDVQEFERIAWELAQTRKLDVLNQLISLFDDKCPYPEVMFGLLHIIESYPDDIYVKAVLKGLDTNLTIHPEWTDRMVNRILNDNSCQIIFCQNMHLAEKESLLKLFDLMEKESPHHKKLIAELREELKSTKS